MDPDDLTPNQLADNFFNSLNRDTKGNVELYVKHAGGNVPANEIKFSHTMGGANHIPGFYTEPIGNKTLNQIRGPGNYREAVDNFYKVQVNTDNLLINIQEGEFRGRDIFYPKSNVGGSAPLGDQIEKIDWDIFAQETGVSFDDLVESSKNSTISFRYDDTGKRVYDGGSEVFTKVLAREVGDTELTFTALRKAGIEGFVSGPTNAQYEVVLLDPNDELGIGKKINIEDTTVEQFKTSQATANQIDEIIIDTPPTDRPTLRVGDDEVPTIKLSGTVGGSGTPDGPNVVYMKTEDAIKMVEYDRMITPGIIGVGVTPDKYISAMVENIKKNGFFLDRYDIEEGKIYAPSFEVTVDKNGYLQFGDGNHRLRAYLDSGVEYIPVHVSPNVSSFGSDRNRLAILPNKAGYPTAESRKAVYEAMIELFEDLGASEYTIEQKLGDPIGDETLIKLVEDFENLDEATKNSIRIRNRTWSGSNYTQVGGQGGNTTSQENIKKFFKAIGIETVTFDELPETDIHKVMVNNPESIVNNVNPNRNTLRVGDDSVPTVHKTIEYIEDSPVVKNPDNFWKESWETLFGDAMTQEEYSRMLIETNTPFEVPEFITDSRGITPNDDGTIVYTDLSGEGPGAYKVFKDKIGEYAYLPWSEKAYWENPINLEYINKTLIPALKSGSINKLDDVEKSRLAQFIYRLQAYESTGKYSATDAKADIIKKVFMGDVPILETGLNLDADNITHSKEFVKKAGINKEVADLIVDNQVEIKNIIQDVIKKSQKSFLPDTEYMLVFRLGDLGYHDGSPNGISSFTKSYDVATGMGFYQQGDKGGEIRAYLVPTEHVIDTEALGIRGGLGYGNEKEVLVVDEYVIPLDAEANKNIKQSNRNSMDIINGEVVDRLLAGEELTDNEIVEAIARQRKNILRTGDDLVELGGANYSQRVRNVAAQYAEMFGLPEPSFTPITVFADEIGAIGADIFDALPAFDPAAIPYYKKFINETNMQYEALLNSGLQIELVDVDPYTPNQIGHQAMMQDMERGVFKILSTEGSFGSNVSVDQNPMLETSKYVDLNGRTMTNNDVFRAVHDTFGHGMRGNTFGPRGEYNAWLAHKELYSPDAQRVMTTETLGQNTFTNYGQHMRDDTGRIIGKGEAGHIKPLDRPFADQKVALMPENYIQAAGSVVTDINNLDTVNPEKLAQVMELAAKEPGLSSQIWNQSKKMVGNLFKTTQVLDPGDIVIEQSLMRMLPRLGLGAVAVPVLYAYVAYELTLLALDVGNAWNKAQANQGGPSDQYVPSFMGGKTIEGEEPKYIDYDWKRMGKDMWQEMGSVSDTWSLSWKISEPIINKAFEEIGEHVVELSDEEKRGYALSDNNIGYTGY
tara:strand:+ start:12338 stop:16423 length:4086 start_codon:yes stop_codon:yes gene_type:complete